MECKELAKLGRWRTRQVQEANRRSSMDSKQEQEVEGETRVRVAIGSKLWFEVEARLNGQQHKPGLIQLRHDKSQDCKMERNSLQ